MAIPFVAAAPAHAVDTISKEGSVTIESFPSTKQLLVDKFDDNGGTLELTEVTVTATVEGELEGSAENLSASVPKTLNGTISAEITVNGTGVSDLAAAGNNAASWDLAPGATVPIGIAASDSSDETITDPEGLDGFVGPGQLEYTVDSEVSVDIDGPAPYKTTGVAGGEATVKIDYTYEEKPAECETSELVINPVVEGDYAIPGGGTFTIDALNDTADGPTFDWSSTNEVEFITIQTASVLTTVTEAVGGLLSGLGFHALTDIESDQYDPITQLTVCAAAGEIEDPDCEDDNLFVTKIAPVMNEDKKVFDLDGGGTFTMFELDLSNPTGETFDWESTAKVYEIQVKGGPGFEGYTYPGGSYGDFDLHAPLQPSQDTWHSVNYILVCSGPEEPNCENTPDMDGCSPPTCEDVDGFKIDPVNNGVTNLPGGGTFTISNKEDVGNGEIFDWDSTVPVFWISVKGGPQAIPQEFYDYRPTGATSGDDLHAPLNESNPNDKWYGLSHITICYGDSGETCEENPDQDGCEPPDPCVVDPQSCEPPEEECDGNWFKIDNSAEGDYAIPGGTFTVKNKEDTAAGIIWDWSSTVPIFGLSVKGGPVDWEGEQKYDYPGGATSGNDVHSPLNPNNDKWYGLSHLSVCLGDGPSGPAGLRSEPTKEEPKGAKEQPAAKVDPVPAPKQEEAGPEPEPEPEAVDPPKPEAEPASAAEPEPTPEPAAGDAPAGE